MNASTAIPAPSDELIRKTGELAIMLDWPILFTREEVLGQLLGMTRLAFELAGIGKDETQRRALFEAIAGYVDVPSATPAPPVHLLKRIEQ